ncbi:MAG: aldehyde dehydrogenase [Candidatus Velamenicoccus archaeovorus]
MVPWNWPILLLLRDLAPGLAAGVTAIVKPAPQTSPVTEHVVRLGREAGLDGGILQLAIGGPELGRALVEHPGIRAVAFTGSTETGAQIMAAGSTTLKRMLLELGGKGSSVIMEDADVPSAVEASVRAAMTTTGQMCMACSRIIAHRSRFAAVLETVIEMLRGMTVGPPGADGSDLGPLISSGHRDRVLGYVDLARRTCQVAWGGEPAHVDGYPGWFMTPAVVTGADPSSPLIQDEIFGPVVSVERFDTLEEAVALANASRYGLTAAVWTDDAEQGWDAARSIEAGTVWVNGYGPSFPEVPSGGFKGSGSGRTRGIEGIEQFTEIKSINWKLPRRRPPA